MKRILILTLLLTLASGTKAICQTVYAADKGEKYHTADCNMSGDAKGMRLETAKKAGKTGCAMCKPDNHFKDKVTQCKGKTADGTRCKRMTSDSKGKCYQHKPKKTT